MYEFKRVNDIELMNDHAMVDEDWYASEKELRYSLQDIGKDLTCPECGSINLEANRAFAEYSRVRLFREEVKRGLFGSRNIEKTHLGDYWAFHGVFLRGKVLSQAYVRCNNCKWKTVDEENAVIRTAIAGGVAIGVLKTVRPR